MPFKLKLKKTRQYNVASKSLFVISVELLDGGVADCTLSVDSTGQECLDNVCQRQAINQPELFGLRYINRSQQPRWVQLERPLKRQLDKYASSHQLYLRVMYYVISGTSLITDEVTRYHYFLQLKNDLIEGRIICDLQQAVVLASYSRQAEYGNHDRERHTVEYLKNLLTFPKQMLDGSQIIDGATLAETGRLELLTAAVIQHHMALHNMSQAQAEEGFITTCQQLRGYGQEMFSVREQLGHGEVTLAVSLTGVRVLTENSDTPHFYRWMDITNVINHKRTFSVECGAPAASASFVLASPEDGKYVWRMCVQQHTFYMRHQAALQDAQADPSPDLQELGVSESRSELAGVGDRPEPLTSAHRARSTSCLELGDPPLPRNSDFRALLPQYRPAPDYETAVQQKYHQQRTEAQLRYQSPAGEARAYGSHPDIHYPDVTRHTVSVAPPPPTHDDYPYTLELLRHNYPFVGPAPAAAPDLGPQLHYVNVYKPPPPYPSNGLASNSTPDLAVASQALNYHRGYINSHVSGSSPDLVSTRTALNRQYLGYLGPSHTVVGYGRTVVPSAHGTYNNLTSVLDTNPHIIIDPHHMSDNFHKVCDERGNVMYSMPLHRLPYRRHLVPVLPATQSSEPHEPIYENVPLPCRGEAGRGRAHSLTTTEEMARLGGPPPAAAARLHTKPPHLADHRAPRDSDAHYVNAQMMKGVRESSVTRDLNVSTRSVDKPDSDMETVALSVDRLSLKTEDRESDETPYQSLSTHKVCNNAIHKSSDNVTSISVSGAPYDNVAAKEKKRRRWGVFMGRAAKTDDVKSATLGRDRARTAAQTPHKHRWSTGLHKLQPLPPSITKETLCQLLERKMSDSQLSFAFEQVPKGREGGCGEVRTALLSQHAALNAFSADHLPYEDNRVRLAPTPANPHGYINASHITMTVGSTQRFYVVMKVSSGKVPKLSSSPPGVEQAALVWECVWQVGARLLALVGGDARPHYLPGDNTTAEYGKFQVSVRASSRAAWGCTVRAVLRCGQRAPRTLWHVHYSRWPPHATVPPHPGDFLSFLSELNGLRLACESEASAERQPLASRNAPLAFCCAQGAGRSGTALAADLLLHILDNNQELDIPRTVSMLHQQRASLIQNVHQYKFLHQILLQYLNQSRLI